MKKLALANLIIFLSIKSVSACTFMVDTQAETKIFYTKLYSFLLFSLIITNISIYFLRRTNDFLSLILIIIIAVIMFPFAFFGVLMEHCGLLLNTLYFELIIFGIVTIVNLSLWVTKQRLSDLIVNFVGLKEKVHTLKLD